MSWPVTPFDPQPRPGELPPRLPSPFAHGPPHPLARRAAEQLMQELRAGNPRCVAELEGEHRGKMFGVLVVVDGQGRVGWLRGFSGMLAGQWTVDGFVPPVFDPAERDAFWPAGEAELDAFEETLRELDGGPRRAALQEIDRQQAQAMAELVARHAQNKRRRDEARAAAPGTSDERRAALHALDQQSRGDFAERRRLRAAHQQQRAPLLAALAAIDERRRALVQQRSRRCDELLERLFAGYRLVSAAGVARSLHALFAPELPPGGAGDCAAPKLFACAGHAGLRPVALAEFWWGRPPLTGGRQAGQYYPSCRRKCGPVLGHLLDGLPVEAPPLFGDEAIAADQPRILFEDRWLLVVEKPVGLLSVPGRSARLGDSVLTRLHARHPEATGPVLVHRLDLDTSGLMLAAKDAGTHAALQRLFRDREIEKRYVAWVEGAVGADTGTIDLALRVDLDDRPRQIHDPVHGKAAVTDWRVLERQGARTRMALYPRTGRTHQLRVHAAHPAGLGAPIAGDRLYGRAGERLLLHAEALTLRHPHTGKRLELLCPAPF